jgi:hypothetical protein
VNKTRTIAGLGAALIGTLALLPSAHGADGATLQAGKDKCNAAIDHRHTALAALDERVNAAVALTAAHRSTIETTINATNSGLDGLKPAIDAATDRAGLTAACHPITVDYRVYVLVVPQSTMAIGFDVDAAAVTTLDAFETGADAIIVAEKALGKDTTAADAPLASLRTESDAVAAAIDGKADSVLTVKPAGWNADNAVLKPYRDSLATAVGHLRTARGLAAQLTRELKV